MRLQLEMTQLRVIYERPTNKVKAALYLLILIRTVHCTSSSDSAPVKVRIEREREREMIHCWMQVKNKLEDGRKCEIVSVLRDGVHMADYNEFDIAPLQAHIRPAIVVQQFIWKWNSRHIVCKMNMLPELYDKTNQLQMQDALRLLERIRLYLQKHHLNHIRQVLDVGCGTGNITSQICDFLSCESIIGMDSSDSMIAYARQHHLKEKITYVSADVTSELSHLTDVLSVECESIDIVVSFHCLHWIPEEKQEIAMKNISSLMAPGSLCCLVFFSWTDLLPIQEQIILHPRWRKYFKEVLEPQGPGDSERGNNNLSPDKNEKGSRIRRKSSAPFSTMDIPSVEERVENWHSRLSRLHLKKVDVQVEKVSFQFKDWPAFAGEAKSICHYMKYLPEEEKEPFLDSYYQLVKNNFNMRDGQVIVDDQPVTLDYENVVVIAEKCAQ